MTPCTMNQPKSIVLNQMEEPIGIERLKMFHDHTLGCDYYQ